MNLALYAFLLGAPLAMLACVAVRGAAAGRVAIAGAALTLAGGSWLAVSVTWRGPWIAAHGWLHVDALAGLLALIVGVSGLGAAWFGDRYMPYVARRHLANWHAGRFHALMMLLLAALALATVANNLGLLWIAIEAATLASAVLVGYYRRPGSVEAAWKYLVLCSVGVTLALFATVLLYCSAVPVLGEGAGGLRWTALREVATGLEPRFVRLAFLFALVGYGAKTGLAPMHPWLPDAYGQAPTPASVLMSGGLMATSLVALMRFHSIAVRTVGPDWTGHLLMIFGLLSITVAVPFILIQGDYKRLLAYSSLEHAGLVTLAIGFGGPLATLAGLFHLLNQSLAKSLAFMSGATLSGAYGSRRFDHWSGALAAWPAAGALFLFVGVALTGLPPAALFLSQWLIALGGFSSGHAAATVVALILQGLIFVGLAFHWTRVGLGRPRTPEGDPPPAAGLAPQFVLVALLLLLGVWIPLPLRRLLEQAATVLQP